MTAETAIRPALRQDRECDPTYRLEEYIASLREAEPEKWARLNADWENRP